MQAMAFYNDILSFAGIFFSISLGAKSKNQFAFTWNRLKQAFQVLP